MTARSAARSIFFIRNLLLSLVVACAGADRVSAQSTPDQCAGLEQFAALAAAADHLFSDLDRNFSPTALNELVALTGSVEKRNLERKLTARLRSLDYNAIKATLGDLRQGATAALLFGRSDLRRFSERKKMGRRVATMRNTINGLCGPAGSKSNPSGGASEDSSMASLISRAMKKGATEQFMPGKGSTSKLALVYAALGGMLVVMVTVPFVTARIYAMLLRRARCQIPARLIVGTTELTGQIIRLSARGMNIALAPQSAACLGLIAKQGLMCTVIINDTRLRAKLSYMPSDDIPTVGLRLRQDLEASQHRELLALSSIKPTRAARHTARPATG